MDRAMPPVAVVGMACRPPGGIESPEQLWEALLRRADLVTDVPLDRRDAEAYCDPEPGTPGRSVSKWGAFLDDVAGFDAEFFGIGEREATAIDPQHRLVKAGGRFVQDQHLGRCHQGGGDVDSAPHTPGVLPAGEQRIEAGLLARHADAGAYLRGLADDVVPGDQRRAGRRWQQRRQNLDRRRLARAVVAEERQDRTRRHREAHIGQCRDPLVRLRRAAQLDHVRPPRWCPPRRRVISGFRSIPGWPIG